MGVSLGDLHYTLGVDESQLDAQLAKAKAKITAALVDPSITKANLALALKSAAVDAKRAIETERLARANLANAKAADVNARSQAALNNTNLTGVGIAQRNAQAQQTLHNSTTISNNAALTSAQRLIIAQNQATASHSRVTTAANAAARSQQNLAHHSGVTSRAFVTQRGIALQLASTLGGAFTIAGIAAFVKQLAMVSGEFELQRVALRAIVRDKEAADKIFSQVKTLSVASPFTFQNLLRDTKQLAAFSIETDKLFGTMTKLADVSAGLGVDMDRIILAYGQVKAATVLRGQELRQFTEAGIPIVDKLAEKFGKLEGRVVSAGEVFEKISKRMVSFKMVDEIFTDLTSSGGMFFEMQKKQSETLIGKISNLKDAYQIMLNSIGETQSSKLKGGVDMLTNIMRNWEQIVQILGTVVSMYGAYRAALILVATYEKASLAIRVASIGVMRANIAANVAMSSSQVALAATTNIASGAFVKLGAIMKANAIGIVLTAIAGLVAYMALATDKARELEKALGKIFKEASADATATVTQVEVLVQKLKGAAEGTQERADAIKQLNSIMSPYLKGMIQESDSYESVVSKIDLATEALYANARAKLYSTGVTAINESQAKDIGDAEAQIRKSLTKGLTMSGEGFGLSSQVATSIIGSMFNAIRKNPALISESDGLLNLLQESLNKAGAKSTTVQVINSDAFQALQKYANSIADVDAKTKALEEQTKSLHGTNTIITENQVIAMDKIASSYDEQRIKAKQFSAGEAYNNEIKRIKIAQLSEEETYLRSVGREEDANAKKRAIQAEAPRGSLAKRLKLDIDALKQFDQANRDVAKSIEDNLPDDEIYKNFASNLKNAKEDLDRALATPAARLTEGGTAADKAKIVAGLKQKFDMYKLINEQLLGQYDKDQAKKDKKTESDLEKRNRAIDELNRQYQQDHEDFANYDAGIAATRIANMENSMDKEFALSDLEYAKRIDAIDKMKQLRLKEFNEAAGIKMGSAGEIKDFAQTGIKTAGVQKLADEGLAHDSQLRINAEKDLAERTIKINEDWAYKIKEIQRDVNDAFLYGIDRERAALNEKYDDWAKKAREVNSPAGTALGIEVEKKRLVAMKELDINYGIKQLEFSQEIEYQKNEITANGFDRENKLTELNFQTFKKIQEGKIALLEKSTIPDQQKQAVILKGQLDADANTNSLNKQEKVRKQMIDSTNQLIEGVRQYNAELADSLGLLMSAATTLEKAFSKEGLSKSKAYSAAISGATSLIGLVVGAADERKRVMDEYYKSVISQQLEYNLLLNDQLRLNSDVNGTVFLKNYEGRLVDGAKALNNANDQYAKALADFNKTEAIVGKKNVVSGTNVLGGIGAGAASGAAVGALLGGGILSVPAAAAGAIIGGVVGLFAGLFAKKKKDVVAPLLETYPLLLDAEKGFNSELAKTLIDNNLVTDATKATLQTLIEWKAAAEKAREQIAQVIADLTGSLGDDLRNALVTAFVDGTDAAAAFGDSVNGVMENILSNMIFNAAFEGAFTQLQDEMKASYGVGADGKPISGAMVDQSWMDDLGRFFAKAPDLINAVNTGLEDAQKEGMKYGFDLFKPTSQAKSGLQGEIKGIKEDTAQLLASLLNAVRGDVSLQNISLKSIEGILSNTGSATANSLAQLVKIESNTYGMFMAFKEVMGGKGSLGTGIRVIIQ